MKRLPLIDVSLAAIGLISGANAADASLTANGGLLAAASILTRIMRVLMPISAPTSSVNLPC